MKYDKAMNTVKYIYQLPSENVWLPTSNTEEISSLLISIKNRLYNSDVVLIELLSDEEYIDINIINSQTYVGNENFLRRKEIENQRKFNEVNVEIDLKEKIKEISLSDFKKIFRYDNMGMIMAEFLCSSKKEVESFENADSYRKDAIYQDVYYNPEGIFSNVYSNLRYVDFDKLLFTILLVEYDEIRSKERNNSYKKIAELKELVEKIEKKLSNPKVEINSERYQEKMTFEKLKAEIEVLNHSFVGGKFYSEHQLTELAEEYVCGQKNVRNLSEYEFKDIFCFTDNEIFIMLKNDPNLLDYFIEKGVFDSKKGQKSKEDADSKLFETLERQSQIPESELKILYLNQKLKPDYLLQLYMDKNKVDLETIEKIADFIDEEFWDSIISTEQLINLYFEKDKEQDKFDKYRKLYKKIAIDGKSLEEKNDISNDILESSMELLKEESILELYNLGLVTVDMLIGLTGSVYLKDLFLSNKLKPKDAKRLYYEGSISKQMLKEIMLDENVDEGKKITLLYSTFPEIEDLEIRKELEAYLREVEESARNKNNGKKELEKKKTKVPNDEKQDDQVLSKLRKAYDPCAKYRLISTIDSEHSFRYNEKDGTGIFYLPNRDEYIIEKLYVKGKQPAIDVATYILKKDVFEQNKDEIVKDGKINISELYALKKNNTSGVKRLVHTGWANAIVQYYELDNGTKYNKEQISEIKKLAEEVEKSKREIEK